MTQRRTFRSKVAKLREAAKVYAAVFGEAPSPFLILTPDWQIVDGNSAYLAATGLRDSLVGQEMFDAFPDNPDDPLADGVSNLRDSFSRAIRSGTRDQMPLQRYDVCDEVGRWRMKYWKPANWPVFDDGRLIALVHHVVDVTEQAEAQRTTPRSRHLGLLDRADLAAEYARRLRVETKAELTGIREASIAAIVRSRSK